MPTPHVGVAGRDPHPNPARQRDHRAASALMIAEAKSLGAVAAMRTRMSRPSSISSAGPARHSLVRPRRDHHLGKSRCSAPQIMPPSINLPGHHIPAPGNLANRCARCKSLRDDRPLLLRAPPPAPLRARQHLNSAHRTVSCTGANHSACTGADRRRIILTRARRPLTEDYGA